MNTSFLARTIPSNVALFIAFETAAFFPVFFFVHFGDCFSSGCTGVHSVWVSCRKLLSHGSSWVLRPLILLLSPASSPEEGVAGSILCRRQSGCSGSVLGSFKALNQDIIPLLCLGCLCPLLKALWLFQFDTGFGQAEWHSSLWAFSCTV